MENSQQDLPINHLRPREKEKEPYLQNAEEATDVRFRAKIHSLFCQLACLLLIVYCLVASVNILKWNLFIFKILNIIVKLIIELVCKLRDEFIKTN